MLWFLAALAHADCADPADIAQARSHATTLETAFQEVDDATAKTAADDFAATIPCIDTTLSELDAFLLHRTMALRSFIMLDNRSSSRSWAAVKALDPDWKPSDTLVPEGHPIHDMLAQPVDNELVPLRQEPTGGWKVDGRVAQEVPGNRAFVLQGFAEDGTVLHTGYHYSVAEVPQLEFKSVNRRKNIRMWGTVATGAIAAGAVTSLVIAGSAAGDFNDPDTGLGELQDKRSTANTFSTIGLGLAGGAAVGGVVTWAVPW